MEITVWGRPEIKDLHKIGAYVFKLLQDKKKTKEEILLSDTVKEKSYHIS